MLLRIIRFLLAASPLVAAYKRIYPLWPPLGSLDTFGPYFAFVVAALLGEAALHSRTKKKALSIGILSIVCAGMAVSVYAFLIERYVIPVNLPDGGTVYRSVGNERTAFASSNFRTEADQRLLQIGGLEDDGIEKMWTSDSVVKVRVEIFFCYLVALAAIDCAIGSFTRSASTTRVAKSKNARTDP